ncbi:MAG TPA: potassium channel family protein [Terriglobales bacterium]|nr:potassium channel family protein [Terriglobales bacterium]
MLILEGVVGVLIVLATLADVFQSIVTPRPVAGRLRISRYSTRVLWAASRWLARRARHPRRREAILGSFGPAIVLVYLVVWLLLLLLGYGLVVNALAGQIRPHPTDLVTSMYIAGTSLFTIGFGDYVGMTSVARLLSLVAAATGLGVLALVVTFLFSLYGAFQRREVAVVTLEASAGAPPSGVTLLETYAAAEIIDELPALFQRWQEAGAEILDSHLAYPVLAYFRSSHDNDSWISSLGAVMDATTLVLTTIDGTESAVTHGVKGWAKLCRAVLGHCIEDMVIYFHLPYDRDAGVELSDYREARERLALAGYRLRAESEGWEAFRRLRAEYAGRVNALAIYWVTPPAQWIGEAHVLSRVGHANRQATGITRSGVRRPRAP